MTVLTMKSVALPGSFANTVSRLREIQISWRERRETKRQLRALSNRQLDDIGLTRADIENIF